MKLFLIGFASLVDEHVEVARALAKKHSILYWVRIEDVVHIDKVEFPSTIFHDYRAALRATPAQGLASVDFEPWDAARIEGVGQMEALVMSMMDKWYPDWPILRRKDLVYEMLRYWSGVLDMLTPDAIVFTEVPHEIYSFILYTLARDRGVKTLMFENILHYDRLLAYADYKKGNEYIASKAREGFNQISFEKLGPYMQHYYDSFVQKKKPTPKYMHSIKREHSGWGKLRRRVKSLVPFVRDGSIVERGVMRIFKILKSGVKNEYHRYERIPDYTKPFVYVPLHYQPERTTSPQGGVFVDQMHMLRILSATLPSGWELYVKEHPSQWLVHGNDYNALRWRGIYRDMASLPGVRLVPASTDTFELIGKAKAVATITGIAAWEALMRGVPAVLFGYPWFLYAPGTFFVQGVETCGAALQSIQNGQVIKKELFFGYLAELEKVSIPGFVDGYGKQIAGDVSNMWRYMYNCIEEELSKVLISRDN